MGWLETVGTSVGEGFAGGENEGGVVGGGTSESAGFGVGFWVGTLVKFKVGTFVEIVPLSRG